MEINIEEIRKLREEIENLRRDVARLDGRLNVIERLLRYDVAIATVANVVPDLSVESPPVG